MWIETGTGVFLSPEKLMELTNLYDMKKGPGQFKILNVIYDLAIEAGLPARNPVGFSYGLNLDTAEIFTGQLDRPTRKINWEDFRSF